MSAHTNECTADLDHPCDGGGRSEDDVAIPCTSCAAEDRYWRAYFKGMPRELSREEYRDQMIDAGRGHLLRDNER